MVREEFVKRLRCPIDGQALTLSADGRYLINQTGGRRYPIRDGIAMLLGENGEALPEECASDRKK